LILERQSILQVQSIHPRIGGAGNAFALNGFLGHSENGTFGDINGTAGQWISHGRVNGAAQTLYGSRIQRAGRALVMGFDGPLQNTTTPTLGDAFIQWIGNNSSSVTPGNLEFRVADNPTNAAPKTVLQMSANGTVTVGTITTPGASLIVSAGTVTNQPFGIRSFVDINTPISYSEGIVSEVISSQNNTRLCGIYGRATSSAQKPNAANETYGVYGFSANNGFFNAGVVGEALGGATGQYGIYGAAPSGFAGYFEGVVFSTGGYQQPSDKKLKRNIETENNITEKIMKLNPVNYYYLESAARELNMPKTFQHGFLAQEVEKLFPEIITEVTAPVRGERSKSGSMGKIERMETFKSINYTMLIPILTKAIQEQQQTIEDMKKEMAIIRNSQQQTEEIKDQLILSKNNQQQSNLKNTGYALFQNIPNPFSETTTISYSLPSTTDKAILMITDLNGRMLLQYSLAKGSNQQVINGNTLKAGIYNYSLIVNGAEIMTKRMVLTK
jgi:hypothetical protein